MKQLNFIVLEIITDILLFIIYISVVFTVTYSLIHFFNDMKPQVPPPTNVYRAIATISKNMSWGISTKDRNTLLRFDKAYPSLHDAITTLLVSAARNKV